MTSSSRSFEASVCRWLTENMRSDPGIFNFVKRLRVGEEACPTLEQAKARLKELYPDTTLVISHSKRMAVNVVPRSRMSGCAPTAR